MDELPGVRVLHHFGERLAKVAYRLVRLFGLGRGRRIVERKRSRIGFGELSGLKLGSHLLGLARQLTVLFVGAPLRRLQVIELRRSLLNLGTKQTHLSLLLAPFPGLDNAESAK
jgi:hypothetical protein